MKDYYDLKREEQDLRITRDAAKRRGDKKKAQKLDKEIKILRNKRSRTTIPTNNPYTTVLS